VAGRPRCLCVAGPNGSGKSTLVKRVGRDIPEGFWIDPDYLAEQMRQERGNDRVSDDEAFRAARNRRVDLAENLQTFGFETVFSHGSNVAFLRALKEIGYEVNLFFICTEDPEINVRRVGTRVAIGGHNVPTDKIIERYWRSLDLLSLGLQFFDRVMVLDNSLLAGESSEFKAGGRNVADIRAREGFSPRAILYAPIPLWVHKHVLLPLSTKWRAMPWRKQLLDHYGRDIQFRDASLSRSPGEFLKQFRW
jgi:predicted ABC-type ATPase